MTDCAILTLVLKRNLSGFVKAEADIVKMNTLCCGPKCSACCMIISIWGVVMLALMGLFLNFHALTFSEDLKFNETLLEDEHLRADHIDEVYKGASMNCFYAAGAYVVTFVISVIMWRINMKSDYTTA